MGSVGGVYYGLLADAARDRDRLLALVPAASDDDDEPSDAEAEAEVSADPAPTANGYRVAWAKLLARIFGHQVLTCPSCGSPRTILAAITERDVAAKLLDHLHLPTDVPELARARPPPQTEWFADDWPVA